MKKLCQVQPGWPGSDSTAAGILLFATKFIRDLRSAQFPVNRELGALPPILNWLGKSDDLLFPATANYKNAWMGEWIDCMLFNNDVSAVIVI
jgi:hypothetical protein